MPVEHLDGQMNEPPHGEPGLAERFATAHGAGSRVADVGAASRAAVTAASRATVTVASRATVTAASRPTVTAASRAAGREARTSCAGTRPRRRPIGSRRAGHRHASTGATRPPNGSVDHPADGTGVTHTSPTSAGLTRARLTRAGLTPTRLARAGLTPAGQWDGRPLEGRLMSRRPDLR